MKLRVEEHNHLAAVVFMEGNVMGGPDGTLLYEKLNELKDGGLKNIVLDMNEVQFMNSSGLGMLMHALSSLRNAGGELVMSRLPGKVLSLMLITKLNLVIDIFDDVESALAKFDAA